MRISITGSPNYVVQHADLSNLLSRRYSGWHVISLVLSALAIVLAFGSDIAVAIFPSAVFPILTMMTILLIGATALTFISLYSRGEIIEARFDQSKQLARLHFRGSFAHTNRNVPFDQITGARMAVGYDKRGHKFSSPILDFTNGRQIALPPSTTWNDIEAIRAMVAKDVDLIAEAWARKSNNTAHVYRRPRSSR